MWWTIFPSWAAASWACRKTPLRSWGGERPYRGRGPAEGRAARVHGRAVSQNCGRAPGAEDFLAIVHDIADHRYSKIELTAFVVACNRDELDREEVFFLSDAMVATGQRLDWHEPLVVDKHCIGGIPGNRTSMLIVPIVAAHGMLCPKRRRAPLRHLRVRPTPWRCWPTWNCPGPAARHRARPPGCLAWGGTAHLSPADDVLISVERPLSIDSPGQMVASILSKNRRRIDASGARHTHRPHGQGAFHARGPAPAPPVRVCGAAHATVAGCGHHRWTPAHRQRDRPVLEARDVMRVLENDPGAQ